MAVKGPLTFGIHAIVSRATRAVPTENEKKEEEEEEKKKKKKKEEEEEEKKKRKNEKKKEEEEKKKKKAEEEEEKKKKEDEEEEKKKLYPFHDSTTKHPLLKSAFKQVLRNMFMATEMATFASQWQRIRTAFLGPFQPIKVTRPCITKG
ncbi:unnamed protein product [Dibothriocephalus latus]|uniref:Uncharacterized protein n=1 Tax=Dibothriocephalus latus TaxID=60516 RepID=A0A3P7L2I0_DIBLA|nr:unnamed protein product [Dibothriocephalus latus]